MSLSSFFFGLILLMSCEESMASSFYPEDFSPEFHKRKFNSSLLASLTRPAGHYDPYDTPSIHLTNMVYASLNCFFGASVLSTRAQRDSQQMGLVGASIPHHGLFSILPHIGVPQTPIERTNDLWTETDKLILQEEIAKLHPTSQPPAVDSPVLKDPNDGVVRAIGEYFKRRTLLQDVKKLQLITLENKPLIVRIFSEFSKAGLYREKDTKIYRDFFYEFEDDE